jgi:hypothetical protein
VTIIPREEPELEVPVDLTVRRDDRSNTVTIEPRASASPKLARSIAIEELSKRAVEIGNVVLSLDLGVPLPPESLAFPEFNINFAGMTPRGWIGAGLSFGGSITHKDEDGPAEWRFDEPPSIKSVHPDSPADEAGLQVNDVLLEIDGLKLDSGKGGKRFSRMEPGQIVEWKVRRGGKTFTVETEAAERPQPVQVTVPLEPLKIDPPQALRYTGALGGTEIEVRGGSNVRIEVNEETGEIVIRSADSVVKLKSKDQR